MRYPTNHAKITIETEDEIITFDSSDIQMKMYHSPSGWNWTIFTKYIEFQKKSRKTFYWEDTKAPPNEIGPVCIYCRNLIDSKDCHGEQCPVRQS